MKSRPLQRPDFPESRFGNVRDELLQAFVTTKLAGLSIGLSIWRSMNRGITATGRNARTLGPLVSVEMKAMARLLSVNVGLPRDIEWQGKTVHTAVWKAPVQGRRMARRLNVDGDGQGDLAGHGGEHRAVFVYLSAQDRNVTLRAK